MRAIWYKKKRQTNKNVEYGRNVKYIQRWNHVEIGELKKSRKKYNKIKNTYYDTDFVRWKKSVKKFQMLNSYTESSSI